MTQNQQLQGGTPRWIDPDPCCDWEAFIPENLVEKWDELSREQREIAMEVAKYATQHFPPTPDY